MKTTVCLILLAGMTLAGCPDERPTGRVTGRVSLADIVCPPTPGDLRGTLVVITTANRYGNLAEAGIQVQAGVDLGVGPIDFEVKTPPGSYYLFAFLDENDNVALWPAMEVGDPYGNSAQAVEVEADRKVSISLELTHTRFASSTPLDFSGVCGEEPFSDADRSCLLEFIGGWVENCYPLLGLREVEWTSIMESFRTELQQVQDDNQLYSLLSRLLAGLQDAHVWLDPATSVFVLGDIVGGEPGRLPGFSIALVDSAALVAGVESGSQAEQQGLQPGDRLETLGGRTVAEWLDLWQPIIPVPNPQYTDYLLSRALLVHPLADPVSLEGLHADQTAFTISLQPVELRTTVAELPIGQKLVTSPDGREVGLITMGAFAGDSWEFAGLYAQAMEASLASEALVFDLRGNSGGSMTNLHTVLSILYDQSMDLVLYWGHHADPEPLDVLVLDPLPPVVTHPLVVLVDESCYSTCNLFAQILQETGRGTVLGRPTGGGNSSPAWVQLSETLGFHIPALYLTTSTEVDGEIQGIIPDVPILLTREDIQGGGYDRIGDPESDTLLSSALTHLDAELQY